MLGFLVHRLILAILTCWTVSVLAFVAIQLRPGDYIAFYIAQMFASGSAVSAEEAEALRHQYGLDQPLYIQDNRWMQMVVRSNYGVALEYGRPVADVIGDRIWLTMTSYQTG
jgi:peptide/nickel transport system permease protein